MSKSSPETSELYVQVHRRMVESGEWDRVLKILSSKLSEHGWPDELRHRAKERARLMDPLSFQTILEEMSPHAHASVAPAVKRDVTNMVRQYVKDQFEK